MVPFLRSETKTSKFRGSGFGFKPAREGSLQNRPDVGGGVCACGGSVCGVAFLHASTHFTHAEHFDKYGAQVSGEEQREAAAATGGSDLAASASLMNIRRD